MEARYEPQLKAFVMDTEDSSCIDRFSVYYDGTVVIRYKSNPSIAYIYYVDGGLATVFNILADCDRSLGKAANGVRKHSVQVYNSSTQVTMTRKTLTDEWEARESLLGVL